MTFFLAAFTIWAFTQYGYDLNERMRYGAELEWSDCVAPFIGVISLGTICWMAHT